MENIPTVANFLSWLEYDGYYSDFDSDLSSLRAILAWGRINAKPSSISFKTASGTLSPQTVRLESDNSASRMLSAAGTAPRRTVVIFGVRGHPTVPDTNMQEGYTFFHEHDTYVVRDVILTLGEIQGLSEAIR